MLFLFRLATKSAWNRKFTLGLMLISISLSTVLLIGVERIRHDVRSNFIQSVSGTDLIVGARTSPIQLLLYSVFRVGGVTNNIGWEHVQEIKDNPAVAWTIPVSLGDSHNGFPVLATNQDYFTYFRYGDKQLLEMREGKPFHQLLDAVIGADVAHKLGYHIGDKIILSHGISGTHLNSHDDRPFTITGILTPTGTSVDRTIHISLEAMQAIHLDWQGGARMRNFSIPDKLLSKFDLTPQSITAIFIGLHNRASVFSVQREINNTSSEPLLAILPGATLDELWQLIGTGEKTLLIISGIVTLVGLAGLTATILASLGERRRELSILRSVGASPRDIFALLAFEGIGIMLLGILVGLCLLTAIQYLCAPLLANYFGVQIQSYLPNAEEGLLLLYIFIAGTIASMLPAIRAYRLSLSDGLTPKI